MLIAGMSVVAALAFVLGLGAVCVWGLRKWGSGSMRSRQRIPVEVVQRVPLGPKTGLAVVRIGEKVMAMSVGEGGIRPLFELDEADRQRVIASSPVPTLHVSSAAATAAFSMAPTSAVATPARASVDVDSGPVVNLAAEVPGFLVAPLAQGETRRTDRDFRSLLNVSLSHATRLVAFAGAILLLGAGSLQAQAARTADSTKKTPASAVDALSDEIAKSVIANMPTALPPQIVIPRSPDAPAVALPKGRSAPTPRKATVARTPTGRAAVTPATPASAPTGLPAGMAVKAPVPPTGNGADLTAQAAAAKRPMNDMKVTPAQNGTTGSQAATPAPIAADDAIMRMMPQMDVKLGDGENGGLRLNGTVGIVVMMGLLTLLPTLLLMMTGFTRILIVLHFLKQAMGTQTAPPAQLLGGMALLLTAFVMGPTLSEVNQKAITPWLDGKMTQVEMLKTGVQPFRTFMLKQTRESDLKTFVEMSRMPRPATVDDVPLHVLMSAFVASELRTAFQIGFAIYLPFIIIDAVVASVLMSMGMFMLPPAMISLPFKLLLFVLVDGWSLTISSLVQSFK